jgi:hypothetical protein
VAVVIWIELILPRPAVPPNITLLGAEILIPVVSGVLLSLFFAVQIPFRKPGTRKNFAVWAALAIAPCVLMLLFLYVPVWLRAR